MNSPRKIATVTGAFFVLTFIASIGGLILYGPLLNDPNYVVGAGADARVSLGALFEVILAISCVGTAVTLYPLLNRQNEGFALGYVAARVLESTVIVVGIVSLLAAVTLRQDLAGATGADAASLVIAGRSLVAIHNWTFLLGPGIMAAINGLLLGWLMYRSHLVPRRLAMLGLAGAPLLFASGMATLFGLYGQLSVWGSLAALPIAAWEASLGIYLIVKGFKLAPLTGGNTGQVGVSEHPQTYAATVQ